MKLDSRIILQTDILTCFDIERAKGVIGQIGYFADDLYRFDDLRYCDYGTLTDVRDSQSGGVFHRRDADSYQWFFIPESILKPKEKEKKWRPFTLDEFRARFPLLSLVTYRTIGEDSVHTECFTGYEYKNEQKTAKVNLGGEMHYALEVLFTACELKDEDGKWTPFGIEE